VISNNVFIASEIEAANSPITFQSDGASPGSRLSHGGSIRQRPERVGATNCCQRRLSSAWKTFINNAVPDQTVTFSVSVGNGTINGQSAVEVMTDPAGVASIFFRLSTMIGANAVAATYSGLPGVSITFSCQGTVGIPTPSTRLSGDEQQGNLGMLLSELLVTAVRDSFFNPSQSHRDLYGNPRAAAT